MSLNDPMALPLAITALAAIVAFFVIRGLDDERDEQKDSRSARIDELLAEKKGLKPLLEGASTEEERQEILERGRVLLAELDALGHTRTTASPRSSKGIWAFTLLISALFIGGSIKLVQQESQERMDDPETTARLANMKIQKELEAARDALEEDPTDIDALIVLTRRALLDGDLPTAMNYVMSSEESAPNNPKMTIYSGGMAVMVGMADRAVERIAPVVESHPDDHEAHWWLGVAYASMKRFDEALIHLAKTDALASESQEAAFARGMIAEIEAARDVEVHASGVVTLSESASVPEEGILFVAALRAPVDGGPPLAAVRFPQFSFPMKFSMSAANMPMGGEWPEEFWMRVRIDADGDPMTASDEDLKTAILGPFARGESAIEIVLSPE